MKPATSDRKRTPSSTALLSAAEAVAGVAVLGQRLHGQPLVVGAAAVVNAQVCDVIALPAASDAPLTVAEYRVPTVSGADGVNRTVRDALS